MHIGALSRIAKEGQLKVFIPTGKKFGDKYKESVFSLIAGKLEMADMEMEKFTLEDPWAYVFPGCLEEMKRGFINVSNPGPLREFVQLWDSVDGRVELLKEVGK